MTKNKHKEKKTKTCYAVTNIGSLAETILTSGVKCIHSLMCRQSIKRVLQLERLQNGQVNIGSFIHITLTNYVSCAAYNSM